MQGELARRVAQSMTPVVRSIELRRARITSFEDLDAYGMTLRGVELMHRLSRDDFMLARKAFETAIELPREVRDRFSRLAAESNQKQRKIESADELDFETFRQRYLAPNLLRV